MSADSMERSWALLERNFSRDGGCLVIGGVRADELAATYGTPLYVYDRQLIDRQLERLRQALPPVFDLFYSVKANPNLTLLRHYLAAGCGLEIASAGELEQARAAGCPPDRMLYAGPGKTDAELELAIRMGIGEVHAESANEVRRLGALCRAAGQTLHVALRVNPGAEAAGGAMRMAGTATPFGIDAECLAPVVEQVLADERLELTGIHLFAGTQILSSEVLLGQYRQGLEIAREVAARSGRPLRRVDFGGGLGIPYFPGEGELDLGALGRGLTALAGEAADDEALRGTRFVLEPGRFLIGEAGVYLTRIVDAKTSKGKQFLVCDGGMHHHLAASGNLGTVIKRNFPMLVANRLGTPDRVTVDVVGPLCTPLDTLAREASLPPAGPDDLIAIFQSGAYARAASPLGFLSHPAPPEVWIDRGSHALIRERGTVADLLRDQAEVLDHRAAPPSA